MEVVFVVVVVVVVVGFAEQVVWVEASSIPLKEVW